MRVRRAGLRTAACLLVASLAAGCSSSSGDRSKPTASTGVGTVVLAATIALEGALNANQRYSVPFNSTDISDCKSFAARHSTSKTIVSFVPPLPPSIAGERATWVVNVSAYEGPGTYRINRIPDLRLTVATETPQRFAKTSDSQARAKVNEDGSGSLSFTDLADKDGKVVSGKVHWTCRSQPRNT